LLPGSDGTTFVGGDLSACLTIGLLLREEKSFFFSLSLINVRPMRAHWLYIVTTFIFFGPALPVSVNENAKETKIWAFAKFLVDSVLL